jgi:putative spermidine/putrescine transport system permease protein
LGANRWVAFFKVTLPLMRPGIAAGALFAFITSFDNVPVSIFLTGIHTVTLPVKIFTAIEFGVDPTVAAVSSLLIFTTAFALISPSAGSAFTALREPGDPPCR